MIAPLTSPAASASQLPLEKLAGSRVVDDAAKRAEAARQFEAMLLRQILSEAQKPVFQSSLVKDSAPTAIYRELAIAQVADAATRHGGLGLAQVLSEQLQSPPAPATRPTPSHEGNS